MRNKIIPGIVIIIFISLTINVLSQNIEPEMVYIDGGDFQMGTTDPCIENPDEKVIHNITVNNFYISKYECTNREYCEFLNDVGNQTEGGVEWIKINTQPYCGVMINSEDGQFIPRPGYENHPIVYVTWYGAVAYCNWLSGQEGLSKCYGEKNERGNADITKNGYRLPTDAEWEYACRGGTTTLYYWGDVMNDDYCWYTGNAEVNHHEVGQKLPNPYGLFDMSGNVWEWCSDWCDSDYYCNVVPTDNPTGPVSGELRVKRGGSWSYYAINCRSGIRCGGYPDYRSGSVGFRIARTL